MFSRHSELPLFSWHKQDNMLASVCAKTKLLGWICLGKWFTVPWAFNLCYFSPEICNGTFYLLSFDDVGKKKHNESGSGNQTIIRKWHGESQGEGKFVHSQQVAQVHKSHEMLHCLCQSCPHSSAAKIRLKYQWNSDRWVLAISKCTNT